MARSVIAAVLVALCVLTTASGAGTGAIDEKTLVSSVDASREMLAGYRKMSGLYVKSSSEVRADVIACQKEMIDESSWAAQRLARRTESLVSATMMDYAQVVGQYEQCTMSKRMGNVYAYLTSNTTCAGKHFADNDLTVGTKLVQGEPKVKFSCNSLECYNCMASLGCGLDDLVSKVTEREVDPDVRSRAFRPRRSYFGNRQLEFDGKRQYAKLPQLGKYTSEFTFEGWFAWTPSFDHATNGPSVKLFDFFAEDPTRKAAYEDSKREFAIRHKKLLKMGDDERSEWQKKMAERRLTAEKENKKAAEELRKHEAQLRAEREVSTRENPFDAIRDGRVPGKAGTTLVDVGGEGDADIDESSLFNDGDDELFAVTATDPQDPVSHKVSDGTSIASPKHGSPEIDGEYGLRFSKRPPVLEPEHVTQISFSPGQFVPEEDLMKKGPERRKPLGMRLIMDKAEVMCNSTFPTGSWNHLAVVVHKRGSTSTSDCCWSVHVYVNAELVCTSRKIKLSEVSLERILFMVDSNFLGRDQLGHRDSYFEGYMDNVRLWNRVRSLEEILAFAHKEVDGKSPGLIASYNFDELRTSTDILDRTLNKLNGVLGKNGELSTCPKRVAMRASSLPHFDAEE